MCKIFGTLAVTLVNFNNEKWAYCQMASLRYKADEKKADKNRQQMYSEKNENNAQCLSVLKTCTKSTQWPIFGPPGRILVSED